LDCKDGKWYLSGRKYGLPVDINPTKELELDRDNFLKQVNAKLVDDTDITLSGKPGKEFSGVSADFTFRKQGVCCWPTSLSNCCGGATSTLDASRVTKFLQSFEFTKKAQ